MDDETRPSAETFRLLIWQKLVSLLGVPVFAVMLYVAPVTDSWGRNAWIATAAVGVLAIGAWLWRAWSRAAVRIDDEGVTMHSSNAWQTWPHTKLLKWKQIGRYRVKLCYDAGVEGKHMHVTGDFTDSDGFVDALLDHYAATQGHDLTWDEDAAA